MRLRAFFVVLWFVGFSSLSYANNSEDCVKFGIVSQILYHPSDVPGFLINSLPELEARIPPGGITGKIF